MQGGSQDARAPGLQLPSPCPTVRLETLTARSNTPQLNPAIPFSPVVQPKSSPSAFKPKGALGRQASSCHRPVPLSEWRANGALQRAPTQSKHSIRPVAQPNPPPAAFDQRQHEPMLGHQASSCHPLVPLSEWKDRQSTPARRSAKVTSCGLQPQGPHAKTARADARPPGFQLPSPCPTVRLERRAKRCHSGLEPQAPHAKTARADARPPGFQLPSPCPTVRLERLAKRCH